MMHRPEFLKNFLKNKTLKEVFWSFASRGSGFVFFLAINIILARSLGVERYGAWSFFYSFLIVLLIISYFGVNSSARKYIAQHNGTKELNNVLSAALSLRIIIGAIFCVGLFLLHRPIATLLGKPFLAPLLLWSSPLIFVHGLLEYLKSAAVGIHRLKYNFVMNFVEYLLKFILVITTLFITSELVGVVVAFTIASTIAAIIGFLMLYKRVPLFKKNKYFKEILAYSMPLLFVGLSYLVATQVDTIMLGLLQGEFEVGIYAVSKDIIGKLPQISSAFALGSLPVFAKLVSKNKQELKKKFRTLMAINGLGFFIILCIFVLLAPYLIPLLYGPEYVHSILPLQILSVFALSAAIASFVDGFLDYVGKAKKRALNYGGALVMNILLNLMLIPLYGAVGAAIATSASYLPSLLLNLLEVRSVFRK